MGRLLLISSKCLFLMIKIAIDQQLVSCIRIAELWDAPNTTIRLNVVRG
jgi:hypothetical protein